MLVLLFYLKQINREIKMMLVQRTLTNPIKASGVGVHSGRKITMNLLPAEEDQGVIFKRIDLEPAVEIKAVVENVGPTSFATTLIDGDVEIATVEHMMSAFAGLGIDNVTVEINDCEVPIMDGSASPFVFLIQSAGIKEQSKPKKFIKIKKEISITTDNGAYAKLSPYDGFKVTHSLIYDDESRKSLSKTTFISFLSFTSLRLLIFDIKLTTFTDFFLKAKIDSSIILGVTKGSSP